MLSIRTRAWSVVSTGILPRLMTCLGPRTEVAGLLARIPAGDQPIEQHADGGKVLLDGSQTALPADFSLTDELAAYAESKGWDNNRAVSEFERFQDHHRSKATLSANWEASWRTWVQLGIGFDKQRGPYAAKQGTGLAGVLRGLAGYARGDD
jgi:hypothetical protein